MKNSWTIPSLWTGHTVAILASGPSMSQAVAEAVRVAGIPAIAVNTTHRLAPWAWMLYAADAEWWRHPGNADAAQFAGLKVSCSPVSGVLQLRNAGVVGYSDEPDCVHTLGNSGGQALQIAVKAGAARVLLCGFDMRDSGHWHGQHPAGLRDTEWQTYAEWVKRFEKVAPALAQRGVDVVNVTPGSALTCFRQSTLEAELAQSPEHAARQPALPA